MTENRLLECYQGIVKELENNIKKGGFLGATMGITISHKQFFDMVQLMVTSPQYEERPEMLLHDLKIWILKVPFI